MGTDGYNYCLACRPLLVLKPFSAYQLLFSLLSSKIYKLPLNSINTKQKNHRYVAAARRHLVLVASHHLLPLPHQDDWSR